MWFYYTSLTRLSRNSPTYGVAESFYLDQESKKSLFIPPGVPIAFKFTGKMFSIYIKNTLYKRNEQFTVSPYDKVVRDHFAISLNSILSERDADKQNTFPLNP